MVGKIKSFFQEVVKEMKKVSWPNKDQLRESTIVVIITTFIFTTVVFIIDKIMDFLIGLIFA
jgi:preprotein translocase subunit SecE